MRFTLLVSLLLVIGFMGPTVGQPRQLSFLTWQQPAPAAQLPDKPRLMRWPLVASTMPQAQRIEVPLLGEREQGLQVAVKLNQHLNTRFLVDTGATYTMITPRLAKRLGVDSRQAKQHVTLATANGTTEAPVVVLNDVALAGYHVNRLPVVIRSLGHDDLAFEGLLGLNFFRDVELTITRSHVVVVPTLG
jgi:clan AA aspartic protease (TIGR02281 family)